MDKNNPNFFAFNRRQLLKTSAALATVSQLPLPFTSKAETKPIVESTEKVVWNTCPGNCHSRCALRLHVKDNEVYQVEKIIPATIFMAITKFVLVCVDALFEEL